MPRTSIGKTVFDAAIDRMVALYSEGHRIVVSFSAGKDSGCVLEVCIIAAAITGRLPVEVIMRDEEIMFPGTFEYAERVAARGEVDFNWIYCCQPITNVYNRANPYWWVFDPLLQPEQWLRTPPSFARYSSDLNIVKLVTTQKFPPAPGKDLFCVLGLRVEESSKRKLYLHASGGYTTLPNKLGVRNARPIYDWTDGDVWRAISTNEWDYNEAYDVMHRCGLPKRDLRISPPMMHVASLKNLQIAAKAYPTWFDKVCERLEGVRSAAGYGKRAVTPHRKLNETWKDCFHRTCIDEAPAWIAERCRMIEAHSIETHSKHSSTELPDQSKCHYCYGNTGCYKSLCMLAYGGDPFSSKFDFLPFVEPDFFRPGSGSWGGMRPSF